MNDFKQTQARSEPRRLTAQLVLITATALALGHCLRQPTHMGANDNSRWCTVWRLLERGTYIIDDCPWQIETQDKVFREPKQTVGSAPGKHFYSSKPALLPTLIAGILYPARLATGVPLDRVVLQERQERWTQKPDSSAPGNVKGVLETPKDPAKWPAYIFYFKPVVVLLNVVPFGIFLVLFARFLDRRALGDWTWFFCLIAGAFGTYLLPFTQTLNNHTVAASSAFFALYCFLCIWDERALAGWRFAGAGFFAAFAAANELPALALLPLLFCLLVFRHPRETLFYFVPAALIPIGGFMAAQYAVFGELKVAYEAFGSDEYLYEGSLWKTPLDLDAFNDHPEPRAVYLFHMTLGHHGVFSLTPIFLFSAWGAARLIKTGRVASRNARRRWAADACRGLADDRADHRGIRFLHLEPHGAELWRLDPGAALAFLDDTVLVAVAAEGSRRGRDTTLGSPAGASGAGDLGAVGGLCHSQSLDSSLDPGRA